MGHIDCCRWLVEVAHCDVNALNSFGCNASQWCAMNGSVPLVQYLVSKGLDVTLLNKNGHSVLHKAAMKASRLRSCINRLEGFLSNCVSKIENCSSYAIPSWGLGILVCPASLSLRK